MPEVHGTDLDGATALRSKRAMDRNLVYAIEHLEEWRRAHPNNWIAVHDAQLVAVACGHEQLLEKLRHLSLDEVYIDFITEEETVFVPLV